MKIWNVLQFVKTTVRAVDPKLDKNVWITSGPLLVPYMGRVFGQVYYNGSTITNEGGGNLDRQIDVGVRLYVHLVVDAMNRHEKATEELVEWLKSLTKSLHMTYDISTVPLQEPIRLVSESPIRRYPEEERPVFFVDQTYRVRLISDYDEVKA